MPIRGTHQSRRPDSVQVELARDALLVAVIGWLVLSLLPALAELAASVR